jgi:hypothetical protein
MFSTSSKNVQKASVTFLVQGILSCCRADVLITGEIFLSLANFLNVVSNLRKSSNVVVLQLHTSLHLLIQWYSTAI